MVKECESCSMRLPGGYTVKEEYLCRACYERILSKESRDSWFYKTEGTIVKMLSKQRQKRK
jgi:hypothetical protein